MLARDTAAESGALDCWSIAQVSVTPRQRAGLLRTGSDFSFDLNVKSMHRTMKAFVPACWKRKQARSFVNIHPPCPRSAAFLIAMFTGQGKRRSSDSPRRLPPIHRSKAFRNAICPGTIESPSLEGRIKAQSRRHGQIARRIVTRLYRAATHGAAGPADEVAALAVFLASDEASYITGQAHLVDGGMAL